MKLIACFSTLTFFISFSVMALTPSDFLKLGNIDHNTTCENIYQRFGGPKDEVYGSNTITLIYDNYLFVCETNSLKIDSFQVFEDAENELINQVEEVFDLSKFSLRLKLGQADIVDSDTFTYQIHLSNYHVGSLQFLFRSGKVESYSVSYNRSQILNYERINQKTVLAERFRTLLNSFRAGSPFADQADYAECTVNQITTCEFRLHCTSFRKRYLGSEEVGRNQITAGHAELIFSNIESLVLSNGRLGTSLRFRGLRIHNDYCPQGYGCSRNFYLDDSGSVASISQLQEITSTAQTLHNLCQ